MMKTSWLSVAFATALCISAPMAVAQPVPAETEVLQVVPGAAQILVKGKIKGYDVVEYIVSARAGQTLSVELKASLKSASFNITPGGEKTSIYNGSVNGNTYSEVLLQDGDYIIRIYMMRNDARRGKTARYALSTSIKP